MADQTPKLPQQEESKDKTPATQDPREANLWTHPVTVIAFLILSTTILLIAANVLGFDKGNTLERLADKDFARGLITYLFSVGTIGVIMIIILSTLLGKGSLAERIRGAKDILSILIGIFGTIVGFYFGSYVEGGKKTIEPIEIAEIQIPDTIMVGDNFKITTSIKGGEPPYAYWIHYGAETINNETNKSIEENLKVETNTDSLKISIFVMDKAKNSNVLEKLTSVKKRLKDK